MRTSLHPWMASAFLFMAASTAPAATIQVTPPSVEVAPGSELEVLISGFGFVDGTDGGAFELAWNSSVLGYQGIAIVDPPWDTFAVDDSRAVDGVLDFVDVFSLAQTPGIGGAVFDIARITFTVTGEPGDFTDLNLYRDTVGWSLAGEELPTEFLSSEVSVSQVPAPAAAWLLVVALAGLATMRRR